MPAFMNSKINVTQNSVIKVDIVSLQPRMISVSIMTISLFEFLIRKNEKIKRKKLARDHKIAKILNVGL